MICIKKESFSSMWSDFDLIYNFSSINNFRLNVLKIHFPLKLILISSALIFFCFKLSANDGNNNLVYLNYCHGAEPLFIVNELSDFSKKCDDFLKLIDEEEKKIYIKKECYIMYITYNDGADQYNEKNKIYVYYMNENLIGGLIYDDQNFYNEEYTETILIKGVNQNDHLYIDKNNNYFKSNLLNLDGEISFCEGVWK